MSLLPSNDDTTPSDVFVLKKNEITNLNKDVVGIIYIKNKRMGIYSDWIQHFFHLKVESNYISYWKSYPSKKKKRQSFIPI